VMPKKLPLRFWKKGILSLLESERFLGFLRNRHGEVV